MAGQPIAGLTGKQQISKGAGNVIRQINDGGISASEWLARYAQGALDGNRFSAANQAAQAVSVALATTYTGLMLFNPVNSGVIVLPDLIKFALTAAPAAPASKGLIWGTGTLSALTAVPVVNNALGIGAGPQAKAYSAATISTAPAWLQQLEDAFTAAALPSPGPIADLAGGIALLPGSFIAIGALAAITGLGSIQWMEVPYSTNS
jgi:hypothetical protein